MPKRTGNTPIIVADSGPLIRLAAAGLLGAMRLTNRQIVIVDRIKAESCEDMTKPFAKEIAEWMESMGSALEHAATLEGLAIATLEKSARTEADLAYLKRKKRDSGERAIREYVESLRQADLDSDQLLVLYEDATVPILMQASRVPLTMMTTAAFANLIAERGYNRDAAKALKSIGTSFNIKPPSTFRIEPSWPEADADDQVDPD